MEHDSPSHIPFLITGFVIGSLLVVLVWFLSIKKPDTTPLPASKSESFTLQVNKPTPKLTTSEKVVTVTGSTGINSVITIIGPNETKVLQEDGNTFSTTVALSEGKNVIDITAYDPTTGNSQHQIREVLNLNEDLTSL